MGSISIPDPGDVTSPATFDDFQRQTSLMTTCTLLWKELSDHFTSLEKHLLNKSDAIKDKIKTLETQTKASLDSLEERETAIENSVSIAIRKVEAAIQASKCEQDDEGVDDSEGLLLKLKSFCVKMDSLGFWEFISCRKKEMDVIRAKIPLALAECVDPARFVLEAISEVFPVDKRTESAIDLGWACVVMLESLIPVMMDPIVGNSRVLVTPSLKKKAMEIAETWKATLERDRIENVNPHTFLQHLVTFGIVNDEDSELYTKLVAGSAWRKQMPKLAASLGLMPDMIEELISRGQQVDAVRFIQEVGLVDRFPPVPLLKAFLKNARQAATSIMEDTNNSARAPHLAARKEQSALKVVIKCIKEYGLEAEFPPENLKKRLEQLEKVKMEKKSPAAVSPANKRTRGCNGGTMPPAKAGRIANTYVSSFPSPPTFVRSPLHTTTQYPGGGGYSPQMYGIRSPPTNHYAAYSPEAAPHSPGFSYPGTPPMNYPPPAAYGGYGNGAFQQAYYR